MVAIHPTYSPLLSMSINTSEYQPRLSAYLSSDFNQFRLIFIYYLLYNHLGSVTCAQHDLKPAYNIVGQIGVVYIF